MCIHCVCALCVGGGSYPGDGAAPDQMPCLVAVVTGQTPVGGVIAAGS